MERRDCGRVISQMIEKIPVNETELIEALKWNKEDAACKAPEETIQWIRTSETLLEYIGKPEEEWHFEVLSIFSTIPVEEIRAECTK